MLFVATIPDILYFLIKSITSSTSEKSKSGEILIKIGFGIDLELFIYCLAMKTI